MEDTEEQGNEFANIIKDEVVFDVLQVLLKKFRNSPTEDTFEVKMLVMTLVENFSRDGEEVYNELEIRRILEKLIKENYLMIYPHGGSDGTRICDIDLQNSKNYDDYFIKLKNPNIHETVLETILKIWRENIKLNDLLEKLVEVTKNEQQKTAFMLQEKEKYFNKIENHLKEAQKLETRFEIRKEEIEEVIERSTKELEKQKNEIVEKSLNEAKKVAKQATEDRIKEELRPDGKIDTFLQEIQKNILQYMGIFLAIFSLIGINIGQLNSECSIFNIIVINLSLVSALATVITLLAFLLSSQKNKKILFFCLTVILWTITIGFFAWNVKVTGGLWVKT